MNFQNSFQIEKFKPSVDAYETAEEFHIHVELPGVEESDVDIKTENHVVIVKGNKKTRQKPNNFHRLERASGFFYRTFRVPEAFNLNTMVTSWENGVLKLSIQRLPN